MLPWASAVEALSPDSVISWSLYAILMHSTLKFSLAASELTLVHCILLKLAHNVGGKSQVFVLISINRKMVGYS